MSIDNNMFLNYVIATDKVNYFAGDQSLNDYKKVKISAMNQILNDVTIRNQILNFMQVNELSFEQALSKTFDPVFK